MSSHTNPNSKSKAIIGLVVILLLSFGLISQSDADFLNNILGDSKQEAGVIEVINDDLYKVTRVVDGDTIKILINREEKTIRLIGLDTPETVHPNKPVECFGIEASNEAKRLLTDKRIDLEFDKSQGEQDKYGRVLAYVILEDGTNFNQYMIEQGYAYEYTYQNNPYKYQSEFKDAEIKAKEENRGLWGEGVCVD